MTISETIAYLQQFSKSGKPVKDLSRMQSLLEELGNPQEQLRFVHIAGTNGKGSVVAYGSAAAIAAGIQTGQFTSPFVRHYQDRIQVNVTYPRRVRSLKLRWQLPCSILWNRSVN